ncbi:MAG: diaminopimelate epimerase [Clostridia bacterium]|nr:diaminopimelate epimerase [Clostridia bacterium]
MYLRALALPANDTVFYKMHGIGNDYIYFDCMTHELAAPEAVSIALSDRHKGIGGDGIVMICRSEVADAKMRMFNADGSEGKMCGNAIRCVGKFLYDFGKVNKTTVTVETLSGIKTLQLTIGADNKVETVRVDMGAPILNPSDIPVCIDGYEGDKIVGVENQFAGGRYAITCVSMGNPHCVIFTDPDELDLEKIGPSFENDRIFPERVNTEFVKVLGKNDLKMRVWERGSGETWACGTGACAVAVAAVLNGYADRNSDITVRLRGGDLTICWTDDTVYMTGSATLAFVGSVRLYGKDGLVRYDGEAKKFFS